jgi:predicted RNase H-like nuclease
MSDTQARLDAIRKALHPRDVHHDRCATRHGRPSGPCDCHARRDLEAHDALDALAAELERVTAALQDIADHCVVSEGEFPDDNCDWHCTAEIVATAKAALAGAARAAQEGDV